YPKNFGEIYFDSKKFVGNNHQQYRPRQISRSRKEQSKSFEISGSEPVFIGDSVKSEWRIRTLPTVFKKHFIATDKKENSAETSGFYFKASYQVTEKPTIIPF